MSDIPSGNRDATVLEVRHACERGDAPSLHKLFAPHVDAALDDGEPNADGHEAVGVAPVTELLFRITNNAALTEQDINGLGSLIVRRHERVVAIVILQITDTLITRVWIVASSPKLKHWNR